MGKLQIRRFPEPQPYTDLWHAMQEFTRVRDTNTPDEIWLLHHQPVFTLGQAGKIEHLLDSQNIPVVNSDRGGQVTYHGPGQLIMYTLLDIKRLGMNVRELVTVLENSVIALLADYQIEAYGKKNAPGVYVHHEGTEKKIAALGLRVKQGRAYHGLSLNIDMDLKPFSLINPCGYAGMAVTHLKNLVAELPDQELPDQQVIEDQLLAKLSNQLSQWQ